MRGFPEPSLTAGTMPRLKLLQAGVTRDRAFNTPSKQRRRLPITPVMLEGMIRRWQAPQGVRHDQHDLCMLRAAATLCFYGFFRSGEITAPSASTFDARMHLAWGDVAINSTEAPTAIRVHLKRSKCDQMGHGIDVFVGTTGSTVCPVAEIGRYVAVRGPSPRGVLPVERGHPTY